MRAIIVGKCVALLTTWFSASGMKGPKAADIAPEEAMRFCRTLS